MSAGYLKMFSVRDETADNLAGHGFKVACDNAARVDSQ